MKAFICDYATAAIHYPALLSHKKVRQEIDRLCELKKDIIMLRESDIVDMHMRIAFADITDFVEFALLDEPVLSKGEPVMYENDRGETVALTKKVNRVVLKNSQNVDGMLIREVCDSTAGARIKLEDRMKSLEFLECYFGINPMDRHKIEYDNKRLLFQEKKLEQDETKSSDALGAWIEGVLRSDES